MFELEVVSVCWDAIDGATIYELLFDLEAAGELTESINISLRFLLCFWYLSVGFRTAIMFMMHLPAGSYGFTIFMPMPLQLAREPTVDRTLQALRNRSLIVVTMAIAEIYAAILRIILWSKNLLSQLQIEMAIKNLTFLISIYSASEMYNTTKRRDWNTREIFGNLKYPSRYDQIQCGKWFFIVCYWTQSFLMNYMLAQVSPNSNMWYWAEFFDITLLILFWKTCSNACRKLNYNPEGGNWYLPSEGFLLFPWKRALCISFLLAFNLFIARVPSIYEYAKKFNTTEEGGLVTYGNALLVMALSILTIGSGAIFWSLSHMLFNKEFTASPGDYHAVHDPVISMVCSSTQIEGAMDILSSVVLLQLAELNLPNNVDNAIQMFALLELLNACLMFSFQAFLSGGREDTPRDLIQYKAGIRAIRTGIDLGVFFLRLVLWVEYNALTSVFLIKNLYNLLHTAAQFERYIGVTKYPKYTLFTEPIPAQEWYGMDLQEWRAVTLASR
jgi:hypothetical protein